MSERAPAAARVVAWLFIIAGALATLSALANIFVGVTGDNEYFSIWPQLIQLAIAAPLPFAGWGLLKGSASMRLLLELVCYLLLLIMLVTSVRWTMDSGNWQTLFTFAAYIVPLLVFIVVLRGEKVRRYVASQHSSPAEEAQ